MADPATIESAPSAPGRPSRARLAREGRTRVLIGILVLLAGIAGFLVALIPLRGTGWTQVAAYAVVAVILYQGVALCATGVFGRRFDVSAWLCGAWIVLITGSAIIAPLLPLGEHVNSAATLWEPIMLPPDLLSPNPLGTNNLGLDMLARVIHGARISLVVSLTAVLVGVLVGGVLGVLAGYYRRIPDRIIGILTNSLLAVPPLILLIALASVLSPNPINLALALALLALPSMVRIARANTMAFAQREFVLAAKAMGASSLRIMARELAPNVVLPLASYAMVMVSVLIVAEASLSFLGLGTPPPTPTWGNMIAEAEGTTLLRHPHIVIVPGLVLFITVFSFNLLGEKARARFDSRKAKI